VLGYLFGTEAVAAALEAGETGVRVAAAHELIGGPRNCG
jgi:hypothetical protein